MNCLLADLTMNLGYNGSHSSHAFFTSIFLFVPHISRFQHPYIEQAEMLVRSIALGGGGVRGGIMIGGLAALETHQSLQFPDGIYGCSAGAILATAVAFNIPLPNIRSMFDTDMQLSSVMPPVRLSTLTEFQKQKGLFSMDMFTEMVVNSFKKNGVELEGKKISDAPQKLSILASNLTTRRATMLSGDVPLLDALRCSSCLPFIFYPQVLFNNVYVDGGVLAHNLHKLVPPECLVFHISRGGSSIFPSQLESISISAFLGDIYETSRKEFYPPNVLWFQNNTISVLQELTNEDKQALFDEGVLQATRFLAKRAV
jgi:hypothetical protein